MGTVIKKAMKRLLFKRQGGVCCYCQKPIDLAPPHWGNERTPGNFATLEHLQRVTDGGSKNPDNLALACFDCNSTRGDMSWVEFKTLMSRIGSSLNG